MLTAGSTLSARATLITLLAVAAGYPARVSAQRPTEGQPAAAPHPVGKTTLMAGLGNMFGGAGVSAERFFEKGRASVLVGAGGLPTTSEGPGTVAFATAVRAYTTPGPHRAYLQASFSLLSLGWQNAGVFTNRFVNVRRFYGPALAAGYRFTARQGFTISFGVGVGVTLSRHLTEAVAHLGVGHTWR